MKLNHCYQGDCRDVMRRLIDEGVRVQCIVTSPPYYGLRDYGVPGQLGQEETFSEFLDSMVDVFSMCFDLLSDDGTLWLNMGDSYVSKGEQAPMSGEIFSGRTRAKENICLSNRRDINGLPAKNIAGQPWRLAFALQEYGWILRQDIIWHKPNPMPESVTDRCTKSHEYIFLLTKSGQYYFDQSAIREPVSPNTHARLSQDVQSQIGSTRANGGKKTNGNMKAVYRKSSGVGFGHGTDSEKRNRGRIKNNASFDEAMAIMPEDRNRRSVWTVPTESFSGAHFATFPQALIEPCVLAGSRVGDIVFDPFMGSGTVAQVAQRLGRRWLGAELNPDYIRLQAQRTRQLGMELEVV